MRPQPSESIDVKPPRCACRYKANPAGAAGNKRNFPRRHFRAGHGLASVAISAKAASFSSSLIAALSISLFPRRAMREDGRS
jgi:hypothetical protein